MMKLKVYDAKLSTWPIIVIHILVTNCYHIYFSMKIVSKPINLILLEWCITINFVKSVVCMTFLFQICINWGNISMVIHIRISFIVDTTHQSIEKLNNQNYCKNANKSIFCAAKDFDFLVGCTDAFRNSFIGIMRR